jgi:HAD superfamily hydrolase (TIGR01509 family)
MTDACIFDLDGVLVDNGAHHRAAWQALLDELDVQPAEPEYWRLTIGRPAEEAVPLLLGRPVTPGEASQMAQRKRDLYFALVQKGLQAIPGAFAFVEHLSRRGISRAVATSATSFDAERLLADVGIRRFFSVIVTAEDVRKGKPDPEVYLVAARRMVRPASSCLVFEDSLVGVQAARRAGMRAIGVTTAHTEAELREAGAESAIRNFEHVTWGSLVRR